MNDLSRPASSEARCAPPPRRLPRARRMPLAAPTHGGPSKGLPHGCCVERGWPLTVRERASANDSSSGPIGSREVPMEGAAEAAQRAPEAPPGERLGHASVALTLDTYA